MWHNLHLQKSRFAIGKMSVVQQMFSGQLGDKTPDRRIQMTLLIAPFQVLISGNQNLKKISSNGGILPQK